MSLVVIAAFNFVAISVHFAAQQIDEIGLLPPSLNGQTPTERLVNYHGAIMRDGYESYQAICIGGHLL